MAGNADDTAEQRVRDAEAALEAARAELSESQGELRATRTANMPTMLVRLKPNVHISHGGKSYFGAQFGERLDEDGNPQVDRFLPGDDSGEELALDGPTAMALVLEGQVDILRSVTAEEEAE
jgi:hypothetical protein